MDGILLLAIAGQIGYMMGYAVGSAKSLAFVRDLSAKSIQPGETWRDMPWQSKAGAVSGTFFGHWFNPRRLHAVFLLAGQVLALFIV